MDNWINALENFVDTAILNFLFGGLLNTLYLAFVSIFASSILGIVLGVLIQKYNKHKICKLLASYVVCVRNLPLILLIIGVRALTSLSVINSGLVALCILYVAIISEVVKGGLISVSPAQIETAKSQGFNEIQLWRLIVLPQALSNVYEPLINQYVLLLKDTSLCSIIGAYELTFTSKIIAAQHGFSTAEDFIVLYSAIAIVYYIANIILIRVFKHIKIKKFVLRVISGL